MRTSIILTAASVLFLFGCGSDPGRSPRESMISAKKSGKEAAAPQAKEGGPQEPGAGRQEPAEPTPRKIIYTSQVEMVVEDLEHSETELKRLIQEEKAYVAKSELHGSPGSPRSGTWTIRVPSDHLDSFLEAIAKLGELRRSTIDSNDITDRYYDLKAHVKNNEVEEQGLQKLYLEKSSTGKLEDLLAVRRELRNIRGEIEQQKGQLQRWDKETAYATVVVSMHDRKDYVPITSPTLSTSISRTFWASWESLVSLGQGIVIVAVALAPWLPVVGLIGLAIWLSVRQRRKRPVSTNQIG
jgi:Domain of unknown function (DUF4349)